MGGGGGLGGHHPPSSDGDGGPSHTHYAPPTRRPGTPYPGRGRGRGHQSAWCQMIYLAAEWRIPQTHLPPHVRSPRRTAGRPTKAEMEKLPSKDNEPWACVPYFDLPIYKFCASGYHGMDLRSPPKSRCNSYSL